MSDSNLCQWRSAAEPEGCPEQARTTLMVIEVTVHVCYKHWREGCDASVGALGEVARLAQARGFLER